MNKHRVLIAGGAGYIGRALVDRLIKSGYRVIVLDNFLFKNPDFNLELKTNTNFKCINADIRNISATREALKEVDSLIHLADISENLYGLIPQNIYKSNNYQAFLLLLELAKKSHIQRFIFVSSTIIYGNQPPQIIITEDFTPKPLTVYGKYKVICEKKLLTTNCPFITTVLRPSVVCGYSPRMRFDLPHNSFVRDVYFRNFFRIPKNKKVRPVIHIDDLADLLLLLLEAPEKSTNKNIFNAGYENYSWDKWASIIVNIFHDKRITIVEHPDYLYSYNVSSEKIERVLGFRPKKKFEDAAKEIVNAFDTKIIVNPYDDRFYNGMILKKF